MRLCPLHPQYQAKRPPRVCCKICWLAYVTNHQTELIMLRDSVRLNHTLAKAAAKAIRHNPWLRLLRTRRFPKTT